MLHLTKSLGQAVITDTHIGSYALSYMSRDDSMFIEGKDFCVEYFSTAKALFFSNVLLPGRTPVKLNLQTRKFIIPRRFFVENHLIPPDIKRGNQVATEMVFKAFASFITTEPKVLQKHVFFPDMPVEEEDFFDYPSSEIMEAIDWFSQTWADRNYILRFFETKQEGIAYVLKTPLPEEINIQDPHQLSFF